LAQPAATGSTSSPRQCKSANRSMVSSPGPRPHGRRLWSTQMDLQESNGIDRVPLRSISTIRRFSYPSKQRFSISSIDDDRTIDSSERQFAKAESPRIRNRGALSKITSPSCSHPSKQDCKLVVIDEGILKVKSEGHSPNALSARIESRPRESGLLTQERPL
jgi:hypothetical protein